MSVDAAPSEMDREDLEDEVATLRETVGDLECRIEKVENNTVDKTVVNHLIAALTGATLDDHASSPMANRDVLNDFNDRFTDVETMVKRHETTVTKLGDGQSSGPEEHWLNTVQAAQNLENDRDHALPDNRVQLYCNNISQATGLSERMAGNYIEDWGEERQGTSWRPYKPPSEHNNGEAKRKRLVVDLDVWGDLDE